MGCTETGPSGIQRLAPLMAGAKGDRVISKSSSEKNRAGYCNLYNHSRGSRAAPQRATPPPAAKSN